MMLCLLSVWEFNPSQILRMPEPGFSSLIFIKMTVMVSSTGRVALLCKHVCPGYCTPVEEERVVVWLIRRLLPGWLFQLESPGVVS